ncbi:Putative purine permease ygfU [Legionella spiritensis]|nr:Putative purine permease ygfU [Legionella spiritensis]
MTETTMNYKVEDTPPFTKTLLLSLQYALLVVPSLIIPLFLSHIAGASGRVPIQMVAATLVGTGIVTILQAWRGQWVIGSGFFMPAVSSAIYFPASLFALSIGGLPLLFTMTIIAGLFEMFLGFIFRWLKPFFPSFLTGFVIMLVGISLGMLALHKMLDITHYSQAGYNRNLILGISTALLMFALTIWGKGAIRLIAPLVGIVYGVILAYGLQVFAPIAVVNPGELSWFQIPFPNDVSLRFDWIVVTIFFVSGLTSAIRVTGIVATCQNANYDNSHHFSNKQTQRGIVTDGLGCSIAGLLGAPGISAAPSLVGISLINGVTSRILGYTVGGLLIAMAFFPKCLLIFTFISVPVSGAALFFLGTIMTMSGLQLINADRSSMRINLVLSLCLLIALSHLALVNFYQILPSYMLSVTGSLLSLGVLFAIALNIIINFTYKKPIHLILNENIIKDTNVNDLLREKLRNTGISIALKEKVVDSVGQIVKAICLDYMTQQPVMLEVVCKLEVKITIHYTGHLYHLPQFSNDMDNEDAAFTVGLIRMYTAEQPDHIVYKQDGEKCRLVLTYYHN